MPRFYQSPVSALSDAEIETLMEEIEATGVRDDDALQFGGDDWDSQAYARYDELSAEKRRRWALADPERAERWQDQAQRWRYNNLLSPAAIAAQEYMTMSHFNACLRIDAALRDGITAVSIGQCRLPVFRTP